MFFKFWTNSNRLERPDNVLESCFQVFDVNKNEYSKMNEIRTLGPLRITYHNLYSKFSLYEIIYENCNLISTRYSIYRTLDLLDVEHYFNLISQTIKVVHKELNLAFRPNSTDAKTIFNLIQLIVKHPFWSPIHFAAKLSLSNLFKLSSNHEIIMCNLNNQALPLKRTPLMLAILSNDYETVKTILQFKPDLTVRDSRGNNLLHFASICSNKIFTLLVRHCISNNQCFLLLKQRNNKMFRPIHFACYSKSYLNVVELLKLGISINLLTIEPICLDYNSSRPTLDRNSINESKIQNQFKYINQNQSEENCSVNQDDEIVVFTEEMISDLKLEDMVYGGSPLHWCQYKRTLEKLLEYKFNINSLDLNHETPLMKYIKDNRFKCLVFLLNAGANPNITNFKGNNCLHEAVIKKDIPAVQACICWDANLNMKNNLDQTPRHIAGTSGTLADQLIVYILHNVGAKRCELNMMKCTADCAFNGLTNGLKYSKWPIYEKECSYSSFLNEQIINEKFLKQDQDKKRKVRMVCFDGGGTKGLISVQMLIELEKKLQKPLNEYFEWVSGTSVGSFICAMLVLNMPLRNIKSTYYLLKDKILIGPRPYDSCLLDYMLQQIIGEHVRMEQILKKVVIMATLADRTPVQLHLFRSYPSPLDLMKMNNDQLIQHIQERQTSKNQNQKQTIKPNRKMFSSNLLDVIIEISRIIKQYSILNQPAVQNLNDESKSNEELDKEQALNPKCIYASNSTFSELTTFSETSKIQSKRGSFKFFRIPNFKLQKLWKACRSSGAAPTFFRASGPFIDGGLIANNPVLDTLTDFLDYQNALKERGKEDCVEELDLVLSIGTGKSPVMPNEIIDVGKLYSLNFLEPYQSALQALNLAQEIVSMATQTDAHVVKRAQAWCSSMRVAYFRLNPPLSESLQLNEIEEVEIVNALWETKSYMHNQTTFIDLLAKLLE